MDTLKVSAQSFLNKTRKGLTHTFYVNQALGVSEAIMFSTHSASDLLDESNWNYMVKQLTTLVGDEDEQVSRGVFVGSSNWHIERFNGSVVPSVYHLIVKPFNVDGEITPAFSLMYDMFKALENYSVLDEENYSKREYNTMIDYLTKEIRFINYHTELVNPDNLSYEDIARKVYSELNSSSVEDICKGEIDSILFNLGFTDYPVYIVGIGSPGCLYDSVSYFEDEDSAREYLEDTVRDMRDDDQPVNRLLDQHVITPYQYVEFTQSTLSNLGVKSFDELEY